MRARPPAWTARWTWATGTITIRGFFPNPHNILRPGQYARVRAATEIKKGALLVPQRAVSELQGGYRVAVVGADGKAEIRAVEPGERVGDLWVIDKGLRPDENVIVVGLQFVQAGMAVNARPAPAPSPEPDQRRERGRGPGELTRWPASSSTARSSPS